MTPTCLLNCIDAHVLYVYVGPSASGQAKQEQDEMVAFGDLSPSTAALLSSLPDTPNSLELKVQYLAKANELRRGD